VGILSTLVTGAVAYANLGGGVSARAILDSVAVANDGFGFKLEDGGLLADCVARNNSGFGAEPDTGTFGIRGSVLTNNNGAGAEVSGGFQLGANLCNEVACP
jgi:hypothetical protein